LLSYFSLKVAPPAVLPGFHFILSRSRNAARLRAIIRRARRMPSPDACRGIAVDFELITI